MKATLDSSRFASALAQVRKIIDLKSSMPIARFIRLDCDGEKMTISATDLQTFIKIRIGAQVDEPGSALAPEIVSAYAATLDDDISIESTNETILRLESGRDKNKFTSMAVDDFPDWPKVEPQTKIVMKQSDLNRLINNTIVAIPDRDPRPAVAGMALLLNDGKITCAGTEGKILVLDKAEATEITGQPEREVIITKKAINEIKDALDDEGEIEIEIGESMVRFTLPSFELVTGRINATAPKYFSVIPNTFIGTSTVNREKFSRILKRAAIMAEHGGERITVNFIEDKIEISASAERGEHKSEVECGFSGKSVRLRMNCQHLQKFMSLMDDESIEIKLNNGGKPIVLGCQSMPEAIFMTMPFPNVEADND